MARINLEDQFWLEIMGVALKMGDQDMAIGNAVRFFRYAQEMHRHGKLVGEDDFRTNGFSEALIPVYAKRVNGGIQCVGAEKHFGWLAQKVEAGRKGGRSRTEAKTKHLKQNQAKPSATEPSYSPSPSSSPSNSASPSFKERTQKFASVNDLLDAVPIVTREQWLHRYKKTSWIENEIALAFAFHSADPATQPTTAGAWMKKLHTWLNKADQDRALKPKRDSLSDLVLPDYSTKEPA